MPENNEVNIEVGGQTQVGDMIEAMSRAERLQDAMESIRQEASFSAADIAAAAWQMRGRAHRRYSTGTSTRTRSATEIIDEAFIRRPNVVEYDTERPIDMEVLEEAYPPILTLEELADEGDEANPLNNINVDYIDGGIVLYLSRADGPPWTRFIGNADEARGNENLSEAYRQELRGELVEDDAPLPDDHMVGYSLGLHTTAVPHTDGGWMWMEPESIPDPRISRYENYEVNDAPPLRVNPPTSTVTIPSNFTANVGDTVTIDGVHMVVTDAASGGSLTLRSLRLEDNLRQAPAVTLTTTLNDDIRPGDFSIARSEDIEDV